MLPKKASAYTRPGVAAAVRLAQQSLDDDESVAVWSTIFARYEAMLAIVPRKDDAPSLVVLDHWCTRDLAPRLQNPAARHDDDARWMMSLEDLVQVVQWKFRIGKARPALWKHLRANTAADVQTHVKAGLMAADTGDTKEAIAAVSKLRGVGPATASAVLSLSHPHLFCFMADEVIEALYSGKRGYTAAIYHDVNATCQALATRLGWKPRAVGRALWTAARLSATGTEKEKETVTAAVIKGPKTTKEATV
jgi:hypothetical protein